MVGVGALRPVVGTPPSQAWLLEQAEPALYAFVLGVVGDGELDLLSVESVDGDVGRHGGVEGGHAGERGDQVIDGGTWGWVDLHPLAGIGEDVGHRKEDRAEDRVGVRLGHEPAVVVPAVGKSEREANVPDDAGADGWFGGCSRHFGRCRCLAGSGRGCCRRLVCRVRRRGLVGGTRRTCSNRDRRDDGDRNTQDGAPSSAGHDGGVGSMFMLVPCLSDESFWLTRQHSMLTQKSSPGMVHQSVRSVLNDTIGSTAPDRT